MGEIIEPVGERRTERIKVTDLYPRNLGKLPEIVSVGGLFNIHRPVRPPGGENLDLAGGVLPKLFMITQIVDRIICGADQPDV